MLNQNKTRIDELWLVDLDDTLVKKSAMNKLLLNLSSPKERERLIAHNKDRLAGRELSSGAIYNPSDYLDDPIKTFALFVRQSAESEDYIYQDATRFLGRLPTEKVMILSFGAEPWQLAKFRALKVNLPIMIINHSDKTRELRNNFYDGVYHIADLEAESVVLIDDRAYSFDGFGELTNARGIFLNRPEFASAHVDDHRDFARALPRNVKSVSSLDEVLT